MKKLVSILLTLMIFLSFSSLGTSAAEVSFDDFKYTLLMQSNDGYSYTADSNLNAARYQMRGMAISHDGKYSFGGYLNPKNTSAVEMFDNTTGEVVGGYQKIQEDGTSTSYPKGLATDDRGYLYVALAYNPNKIRADFAVIDYNQKDPATGMLKEVAYVKMCDTGESKTGVNGITVEKVNGIYYAYIVVNYDIDRIYRYDITIPSDPLLDTTFGTGGYIDLQKDPYNLSEGNYLDVDEDGKIYLGVTDTSSSNHLMVISEDGNTVLNKIAQTKAYGVAVNDKYVFVSSQNSGNICVYDKYTLALVKELSITTDNIVLPLDEKYQMVFNFAPNSICNLSIQNDILFIGDQGSGSAGFDHIYAVGLTDEAATTLAGWAAAIGAKLMPEETTAAPDTTNAPETTAAPETTESTETEEVPVGTPAPETTKTPETTKAPEKTGCGAAIGISVAVIALFGTAIVFKRK